LGDAGMGDRLQVPSLMVKSVGDCSLIEGYPISSGSSKSEVWGGYSSRANVLQMDGVSEIR